ITRKDFLKGAGALIIGAAGLSAFGTTMSLFGSSCSTGSKETIELTYSNFFPPTHLNSILAQEWINEIQRLSDGQVKITYFPGGSLTAAANIYDGVVNGISDIGMSCFAYTVGRFPVNELVDLPHKYPNGWVATKVANDYYNEFKPAELDDTHPLYFHAHGPGVIITTEKAVTKLEDMKGLIIRATGVGAKIVQALGAEAYGASQGETYELMSKGVVKGSFTPREVLKGWNQAQVVKYVTGCYELGYTTDMYVVINKEKWDSFPSNIKKIFTDVSNEWIEKHGKVWDYYDKVAIDYFLSLGNGRQVLELSAEEMSKWVGAVTPLVGSHVESLKSSGLFGDDYEDYLLDRVDYWSGKSPSMEDSVAWVTSEVLPLTSTTTT
ncbi:MAG: TRAP transporter substrate-binding protein, partial [Dehalococcoidales bacterium]|nr:TRAP transporter substrate-binding protein [Dehalococcoidales bacterium]